MHHGDSETTPVLLNIQKRKRKLESFILIEKGFSDTEFFSTIQTIIQANTSKLTFILRPFKNVLYIANIFSPNSGFFAVRYEFIYDGFGIGK